MIEDTQDSILEYSQDIDAQEKPPLLPVKDYVATIRKVEVKQSKANGNRYAAVTFFIAPEAFPADYPVDAAPDGKTLSYNRVVLEDTARDRYNIKQFCQTIGVPMPKRRLDPTEWLNATARVHIKHDTYEGETREAIDKVTSA